VPPSVSRVRPGIRVHRQALRDADHTTRQGIPITTPIRTIVDLAATLPPGELERLVNDADKLDLVDPERLRAAVANVKGHAGAAALRNLLDRRTFVLTHSELERRFLPIARRAGLPKPQTQRWLNDSGLTSAGRSSTSSSKPTGFATTAPQPTRLLIAAVIRSWPRRA
jgi:hypothetical protein